MVALSVEGTVALGGLYGKRARIGRYRYAHQAMLIVENDIIPFRGFKAINIFGIVFHRRDTLPMKAANINHEAIHSRQMIETAFVVYYLWYVIEWLIRLIICRNSSQAYRSILFEREAYKHQDDETYLARRKPFAWLSNTK